MTRNSWLYGGAIVIGLGLASGFVVGAYGASSFLPGLVGGFAATLFAFTLAFYLEREREKRQLSREAGALHDQRTTEVRRRFEPVRKELATNAKSIDDLVDAYKSLVPVPLFGGTRLLHPQLLEGAWSANASRLSELVADYELIGDLAFTYGRIEELRWRLRYRSEQPELSRLIDPMTAPLVDELKDEIADRIERVTAQIRSPEVQLLGLLHKGSASLTATLSMSGTLDTKFIPADRPEQD